MSYFYCFWFLLPSVCLIVLNYSSRLLLNIFCPFTVTNLSLYLNWISFRYPVVDSYIFTHSNMLSLTIQNLMYVLLKFISLLKPFFLCLFSALFLFSIKLFILFCISFYLYCWFYFLLVLIIYIVIIHFRY